MSRFLSERFGGLEVYTPGEQPKDMQYIKLNTNESPFPPSPLVIERINDGEISKLNLYPQPECKALKEKLASCYGVKSENIFVSNGSDEILSFAFMAFCDEKRKMAFPDISYGFYKVYGELYGIDCEQIPLNDDFSIDYKMYCGIGRNIVIANPNAPTGLSLSVEEIEEILKTNSGYIVMIDEAYVDFGGKSCVGLLEKYDNLLVVRTYSKSRSMAGARLGFAIASKEIIEDLEKIKYSTNPYNINRLTMIAGEASLDDAEYYENNCKYIIEAREFTKKCLEELGFRVLKSDTNFVFAAYPGLNGSELYLKLKSAGILVRYLPGERTSDFVRITIGTREQMEALIKAIRKIIGK